MTEFEEHNRLSGYSGYSLMLPEERDAILDVIPEDGNVCEVGSFHGASCRYWAERRPRARFTCIEDFSNPGNDSEEVCLSHWMTNRRTNMVLYLGPSLVFSKIAKPGTFDLVLVDADHDYEPCRRDLEYALALAKRPGIIAAHDYGSSASVDDGVARAVQEVCYCLGVVPRIVVSMAFIQL